MGQPGRRLDLPRSHRFMLAALSGLGAVDRCTVSSSRRHFSSSRRAGAGQRSQGKGRRIPQPARGLLETTRVRFSCGRWASPIVFHCSSTGQVFGTVFCRVLPRGCVTFGAFIVSLERPVQRSNLLQIGYLRSARRSPFVQAPAQLAPRQDGADTMHESDELSDRWPFSTPGRS